MQKIIILATTTNLLTAEVTTERIEDVFPSESEITSETQERADEILNKFLSPFTTNDIENGLLTTSIIDANIVGEARAKKEFLEYKKELINKGFKEEELYKELEEMVKQLSDSFWEKNKPFSSTSFSPEDNILKTITIIFEGK